MRNDKTSEESNLPNIPSMHEREPSKKEKINKEIKVSEKRKRNGQPHNILCNHKNTIEKTHEKEHCFFKNKDIDSIVHYNKETKIENIYDIDTLKKYVDYFDFTYTHTTFATDNVTKK